MTTNIGSSNNLMYDNCAYQKSLFESTSPLQYQLFGGKYENCGKCIYTKYYRPFDVEIVDVESELRNQTRPATKCPQFMYNPRCPKSKTCISTFDKTAPVSLPPYVCPPVHSNIPRSTNPGYTMPKSRYC
jgi:hypothetical protein